MKYLLPSEHFYCNNRAITLLLFLLLFFTFKAAAQGPGCPNVNAGADVTIDCTTNPCVDLTASFLDTGQTDSYEVAAIPYAPPFPFIGLANPVGVGVDDVWSGVVNLPFDFCFFESTYNQIQVGSNGVLRFDVDPTDLDNDWAFTEDIPNEANPTLGEVNIFGVGHDIDPSVLVSNPEIAWDVMGAAPCRTFVLSFANIANFSCNNLISTSQIILYETTNTIEVYVKDKPTCNAWNDGNAIIGIQNNPGDTAFVAPGRNTSDSPWTTTKEAWRFTPNGTPNYVLTWYDENGNTVGNTTTVNVCPSATTTYIAEVTYTNCNDEIVTVSDDIQVTNNGPTNPNAGLDGEITLCIDNTSTIDLFTSLGGTPDEGGTWTPALNSGTGIFDPAIDPAGTYIYSVSGAPCPDSTANVIVTFSTPPNAGENGTLSICNSGSSVDLFTVLGGTPDNGGIWSPPLNSGTGVFDPAVDTPGTYTYSITATPPCPSNSAEIMVSVTNNPNPGENGNIELCISDNAIDLFTLLGGTPDNGGVWTPALNSGTGVFDPAIDPAGTYAYTINIPGCDIVNSDVIVVINPTVNAGEDSTLTLCPTDDSVDLFTILGGTPDNGGTWAPALTSGTGVYNPIIDPPGLYTYIVNALSPCPTDSAEVIITLNNIPNALQPDDLISCDVGGDNVEAFNLEQQTSFITADDINYRATYHINQLDADNGTNRLVSPYNNIANPQTIYTRVEDINSGCINTTINFDLILDDTVIANPDFYELCDDNLETDNNTSNDTTTFNLQSRNPIILGPTQSNIDYTVTYYLTQNDADNSLNSLPSNYENTINPQILFVRVENNTTACFATSQMQLKVNPLPLFSLEDKYVLCIDNNGEIILPSPIIDTELNNNDYTFEWYLDSVLLVGETNSTITPLQTGAYSVIVTNNITGCSSTGDTIVIESTPPTLEAQQVSITFIENNSVLAIATNNSNTIAFFEFSLDNGPWLSNSSNNNTYTFENVPAGEHIITVRDANGCGETSASIILLDFIPYFTPNGDGFHDTWNIIGIENQPDAVIYIFNRYGKLLKELSPTGLGWDGTYNNYVLPSSDYWFSLDYKDPNTNKQKNFKSHFTLKH